MRFGFHANNMVWTGELEADYSADVWGDHDERCHGPIETEENKRDFPKAFEWDCCEAPGNAPGCEKDIHRPKERKRTRI